MQKNQAVEGGQSAVVVPHIHRAVEIANALPVRLQTLDLARHVAIAPDDKRFVVATFDDRRLGRGYVSAVYPQQNSYHTLYRLVVCEFSSNTPGEAMQRHMALVQAIQRGMLNSYIQSQSGK